MNPNILILTTLVIVLCRIRYAFKKVETINDDMDIRLIKLSEIQEDMLTISEDLTDSEGKMFSDDEDLLILDY